MAVETQRMEDFRLEAEPYYLPLGNEVELFTAAYEAHLPVMLKGPTGCCKTRFVEHMSWKLGRTLVTVGCHEDLTASDLVGKYTLRGDETVVDAGCGSGRVTELLLERLPEGHVIAIDGSASMIDAARERLTRGEGAAGRLRGQERLELIGADHAHRGHPRESVAERLR